jgi:hypothetical protein
MMSMFNCELLVFKSKRMSWSVWTNSCGPNVSWASGLSVNTGVAGTNSPGGIVAPLSETLPYVTFVPANVPSFTVTVW